MSELASYKFVIPALQPTKGYEVLMQEFRRAHDLWNRWVTLEKHYNAEWLRLAKDMAPDLAVALADLQGLHAELAAVNDKFKATNSLDGYRRYLEKHGESSEGLTEESIKATRDKIKAEKKEVLSRYEAAKKARDVAYEAYRAKYYSHPAVAPHYRKVQELKKQLEAREAELKKAKTPLKNDGERSFIVEQKKEANKALAKALAGLDDPFENLSREHKKHFCVPASGSDKDWVKPGPLHSNTYSEIASSWFQGKEMRIKKGKLRHRKWREVSRMHTTLQIETDPKKALRSEDVFTPNSKFWIEPLSEEAFYSTGGADRDRGQGKRTLRRTVAHVCVGNSKTEQVMVEIPITMTRPLPPHSYVKFVRILRKSEGGRETWEVHLDVQTSEIPHRPRHGKGTVGVDLGWCKMPDGGYRVAVASTADGSVTRELVMPEDMAEMRKKKAQYASVRSKLFDETLALTRAWLKSRSDLALDPLDEDREVTYPNGEKRTKAGVRKTIHRWRSKTRLIQFLGRYRDELSPELRRHAFSDQEVSWHHNRDRFFDDVAPLVVQWLQKNKLPTEEANRLIGIRSLSLIRHMKQYRDQLPEGLDALLFASHDAWVHKERHLNLAELAVEKKFVNRRRELYRLWLTALATEFDTLKFEDLNHKSFTRAAQPQNGPAAGGRQLRFNRNVVAPAELSDWAKHLMTKSGGTFVKVNPKYTSQMCAECGHIDSENREGREFECVACGHVDDADRNAARNIARSGKKVERKQHGQRGTTKMRRQTKDEKAAAAAYAAEKNRAN